MDKFKPEHALKANKDFDSKHLPRGWWLSESNKLELGQLIY